MSYLTPELPPISIRMCDADRLRKYLRKFGVEWSELKP